MVAAALDAGIADHPCVFEAFARRLPEGRRYGVVGGIWRLAEALTAFTFDADQLEWLAAQRIVPERTLAWLADYRFRGSVTAYQEGELYFPGSPVVRVEGTFAEAVLLETLVLSTVNHDSAIASAAARMVTAAQGRPLLEFGTRRTHEEAAVAAARTAWLCGFAATSNLEAGRRHGVPTSGTSAHAFTLAFVDEIAAFKAQVATLGAGTTLLVDTYDYDRGLARAVEAAGPGLGAVRIDSGDLAAEAVSARRKLDALGATGAQIVASGDLDEYSIAALASAPVDAYGVGTHLVTGSGAPTGEFVYKLVATAAAPGEPLRPVAKAGGVKATVGGRKRAWRERDPDGRAVAEVVTSAAHEPPVGARDLQVPVVVDGEVLPAPTAEELRAAHQRAKAELPDEGHLLEAGPPALPTRTPGVGD
jgi:putative nicotinate phosphoribosyltransferase